VRIYKRHTGVLEGTPSREAALQDAHGKKDAWPKSGDAVF